MLAGEPTLDWPEGDRYAGWDSLGEFVSVELHVTVVNIVSSTVAVATVLVMGITGEFVSVELQVVVVNIVSSTVTVATVIVMGNTVPASATTFKGKLKVSSSAA
jgi:hypothetical protein